MITKLELIEYLKHTPENTNYNILRSGLYNSSNKEIVDEFIEVLSRGNLSLAALQPYLAKLYEDDKTISPDPLPPFSIGDDVQPDWNQNDSTAANYVKNRPFYTGDLVEAVLVEESTVSFADAGGLYMTEFLSTFSATVGDTYAVNWDGTEYECVCSVFNSVPVLGNLSIPGAGSDTGEPFVMLVSNGKGLQIYTSDTSATHTFSISGFIAQNVQIPDKYISDTFRDVIIAGDPLKWSAADWTKYYDLFLSGKLLQIITNTGSTTRGYVSSMFYNAHPKISRISFIDANGNLYSLGNNSAAGKLYWQPLFDPTGAIYLKYQQAASDPNSETVEYAKLSVDDTGLKFTTKTSAENPVQRKVVLEGDKELVLSSSTSGSSKKFKITVDDSGAISATEVT